MKVHDVFPGQSMTQNKHAVLIYEENRYTCTESFMDYEGAIQCQATLVYKLLGTPDNTSRGTVEIVSWYFFTKRLRRWGILKHLEYR